MGSLPVHNMTPDVHPPGAGCGTTCGAGLEKIYPTTAVRWGAMNWIGEFTYKPGTVFRCGAKVVIESERGLELGQQVSLSCNGCNKQVTREQIKSYIDNSGADFFRLGSGRILREATLQDVNEHTRLNASVMQDRERCALLAAQLQLDLKVITCEHLLGGERIIFYFRAEDRLDFRELVRELARQYQTRIEMRQVRARDEARLVADYEICGRECCCKNFLKKLRPVTMKMAKLQKATLDPLKLSGRCGRLRCCLRYEHEGYEDLDRKLPRLGQRVDGEFGAGAVVDRQVLTQLLLVRMDDGRELTIPGEEARVTPPGPMQDSPPTPRRPEEPRPADTEPERSAAPERPARDGHRRDQPSAQPSAGDLARSGKRRDRRRRSRSRRGPTTDARGPDRPEADRGPAPDRERGAQDRDADAGPNWEPGQTREAPPEGPETSDG
jgi:cell fate regulator YaaT (PSP1 superfamily)